MKIKYLGTAAAEGFPALFCDCPACVKSVQLGGRDIRTRAGLMVNDKILLDITPDIYLQKLRERLNLSCVEALFVTHSHTDHFDSAELTRRSSTNYCHITKEYPLQVYGNCKVCDIATAALRLEFDSDCDKSIVLNELAILQTVFVGNLAITPFQAAHDSNEECLLFLVEEGSESFLLANDTGVLPSSFYRSLSEKLDGKRLSAVSMDCTFGIRKAPVAGHMGLWENLETKAKLLDYGCADDATCFYATHFSHNCNMTHEQLSQTFAPYGLLAAHDGLTLELPNSK